MKFFQVNNQQLKQLQQQLKPLWVKAGSGPGSWGRDGTYRSGVNEFPGRVGEPYQGGADTPFSGRGNP